MDEFHLMLISKTDYYSLTMNDNQNLIGLTFFDYCCTFTIPE